MSLPTRKIGNTEVSAIGWGAMGISIAYGATELDEERFKVLDAVYDNGCTFWDTADVYADSEDVLGKWFKRTGKRDSIFLATKFGCRVDPNGPRINGMRIDGNPDYVKVAFESSLKRLGVDHIDLYYLHRADPEVPIELTVGAMADLVKAGKVKYLGLSECSATTLRRAHAVHPIAAIQLEYSPFSLEIEDEKINLLKTARELGVKIVAYAPLGRGLLTGQYASTPHKSRDDFAADDFRRFIPRFSEENFPKILKIADGLKDIGETHNATAGQVALAWLLAQGNDIIPIPGTKKIKYVEENVKAATVQLTPAEVQRVREIAETADASGEGRYPAAMTALLFGDTAELK